MTTKYYDITSGQGVPTFQFFDQHICSLRLFRFLLSDLLDGLAKLVEFCILLYKINCLKKRTANYCKVHYVKRNIGFQLGYILELLALSVELLGFIF